MTGDARDPGYFDALYAADADPWRFETSAYEADKYDATLAALPVARYTSAVEVGCSIGVLTRRLASRCDALLGVDVAQTALDRAAVRCAEQAHVSFARLRMPEEMPEGRFNLIMLSEVLYYFETPTLDRLAARLRPACMPGADLVLVHWLGPTPDYRNVYRRDSQLDRGHAARATRGLSARRAARRSRMTMARSASATSASTSAGCTRRRARPGETASSAAQRDAKSSPMIARSLERSARRRSKVRVGSSAASHGVSASLA
jgi:SAM-dependent methyltransferase